MVEKNIYNGNSKTTGQRIMTNTQGFGIYPIWASTLDNLTCEQQRRRPAWASAQSDKGLCNSLS